MGSYISLRYVCFLFLNAQCLTTVFQNNVSLLFFGKILTDSNDFSCGASQGYWPLVGSKTAVCIYELQHHELVK